ncbi:acyl-CoA dehydrogenase family protein [Pseudoroseomonas wenyumeiae]
MRPVITIDGAHEVNEVFFDEVEVPVENLVGEENKGWDYAKFLLANERTGIARIGLSKQRLARAKRLARETPAGDGVLWDDPDFRRRVAAIEASLKALEITQMRVVANQRHRDADKPDPASSILKIRGSELQQATTALLLEVAGPYAVPAPEHGAPEGWNEPPVAPGWADAVAPLYFNYRKVSIYGGSNEIQRNIIAKAFLGL